MSDLLIRILADGAILAFLAGVLALFFKQWISKFIEYEFSRRQNIDKAELEVEKQRSLDILAKENAIYPEIVEVVYRLRNQFRDALQKLQLESKCPNNSSISFSVGKFGEELFILTQCLYKYRAYIDDGIFQKLHKVKWNLQDARVIFNKVNRGFEINWSAEQRNAEFKQRCDDTIPLLEELYKEVNELYPLITKEIKKKMRRVLFRR